MYGPRSAYDSATLAEHDQRVKDSVFAQRVAQALSDPLVLRALSRALADLADKHTPAVTGKREVLPESSGENISGSEVGLRGSGSVSQ
jgi:hypothetical protein